VDYQLGPYRVDSESRVVWDRSDIVRLPPKAVDFLFCLLERNGGVVLKEELLKRVWPDSFVEESSLAQTASLLRKALKPGFGEATVIETVPRRGYRLAVAVAPLEAAASGQERQEPVETPASLAPAEFQKPKAGRRLPLLLLSGLFIPILVLVWRGVSSPPVSPVSIHPLTGSTGEEDDADISADGTRIVYAGRPEGSDYYNLFVKPVAGGSPTRVTNVEADDRSPAWSPDRSMIAFSRLRRGSREIRVVSHIWGEAGAERLVLTVAPGDPHLAWSPDGKWLAYRGGSAGDAQPRGISLISLETNERRQLTSPSPAYEDFLPAFSPEGRWVAFDRYNPVARQNDIYTVSAGGGTPVRITTIQSDLRGLAWSEHGREIVFASNLMGARRLFRVSANGGSPKWIEAAGFDVYAPSVARSTHRLAFTQGYQDIGIWRAPGAGRMAAPPQRMIESERGSFSPQYSPDGRYIAFISNRNGSAELWLANADGSNPRPLTSFGGTGCGSPSWSPDGRRIAFDRRQPGEGTYDIFLIPSDGGTAVQFTRGLTVHHSPSWSHDGNWIYYSSAQSGVREVWRQPLGGGTAEQITHSGGYLPQESPDGKYVYYTKSADSNVWRAPVSGGPEEVVPEFSALAQKGYWTVTARGYFWFAAGDLPFPSLQFFDLASRKTSVLARGESPLMPDAPGISVSPGGEWVSFARRDRLVRRIMVAENFH
jgi:Tol biopolymer transport system component/DNA-binding winged helix-turn-helix (wHTH) protein